MRQESVPSFRVRAHETCCQGQLGLRRGPQQSGLGLQMRGHEGAQRGGGLVEEDPGGGELLMLLQAAANKRQRAEEGDP